MMANFPSLNQKTKEDLQKTFDEDSNGEINSCNDEVPRTKKSEEISRTTGECSKDKNNKPHSLSRNKRKSIATPKLIKKSSSKCNGYFNGCCLPTIVENKYERQMEFKRSRFSNNSLTELHEKSLNDQKSMAFWRRKGNRNSDGLLSNVGQLGKHEEDKN